MNRRIVVGGLWGALVLSLTVGASTWGRPHFFRRASSTQGRAKLAVEPLTWETDLKSAHRVAVATGKPMLVVFGGPQCVYCRKLEAETLSHPSLTGFISASFVPVHLDFNKDRRAAQILEVTSLPMSLVLSPDADLLGSVEGFVKPAQFAQVLQQSLEYQRTLQDERAVAAERRR